MKSLALTGLIVAAYAATSTAETRFLSLFDDVPLAPGLKEISAEDMAFEAPSGRVLAARASGFGEPALIAAYYDAALPALGWSRAAALPGSAPAYVRGRERLELSFEPGPGGALTTRFRLIVRPAPSRLD